MTDNTMPDEIWACKPELEAYKLTFEIIGSEYPHKKPAVKYHHDDKYQYLIKENHLLKKKLGSIIVYLKDYIKDDNVSETLYNETMDLLKDTINA